MSHTCPGRQGSLLQHPSGTSAITPPGARSSPPRLPTGWVLVGPEIAAPHAQSRRSLNSRLYPYYSKQRGDTPAGPAAKNPLAAPGMQVRELGSLVPQSDQARDTAPRPSTAPENARVPTKTQCSQVSVYILNVIDSYCCCHHTLSTLTLLSCGSRDRDSDMAPTELKSMERQNGAPFWSFWEGIDLLAFSSKSPALLDPWRHPSEASPSLSEPFSVAASL